MPNNGIIDRDELQQKKFGEYLLSYSEEMRKVCEDMIRHAADARDNVNEPNALQAINSLEVFARQILATLPGVEEFSKGQIEKAKYLIKATEIRFRR